MEPSSDRRFSVGDGAAWFHTRSPYRGGGIAIALCSVLGLFLIFLGLGAYQGQHRDDWLPPTSIFLGLVFTAAFLLPGLYLATSEQHTRISPSGVICDRGWCLRRRREELPLSDFIGVEKAMRAVPAVGETAAGAVLGIGAAVATGTHGVVHGAKRAMHVLILRHRLSRKQDILLTCAADEQAVGALQEDLTRRFGLAALVKTLDGYAVRRAEDANRSLIDRRPRLSEQAARDALDWAAAARPAPAATPAGMAPDPSAALAAGMRGGMIEMAIPPSTSAILGGVLVGLFMLTAGLLGWIVLWNKITGAAALGATLMIGFGIFMLALGGFVALRRSSLWLGPYGVALFDSRKAQEPSIFLPWEEIRDVAVSRNAMTRQTGLLVVTGAGDVWLVLGQPAEVLERFRRAILAKAAQVAAERSGGISEKEESSL